MFNKIINTFGTKALAAIINLFIAVVISHAIGDVGKGEQTLLLTSITFILIFSEIVCGSSLVYLTPKHEFSKLVIPCLIWSTLIGVIMGIGFYIFTPNTDQNIMLHVGILSIISSFSSINTRLLIGKEEIKKANILGIIQPLLTIITLLIYYLLLKKQDINGYIIALYISYSITFIIGILLLKKDYANINSSSFNLNIPILKDLFKYGFLNQTGHFIQFFNLRLSYYLLNTFMDAGRVGVFSNAVSLSESIWIISRSIALVQYARIANSNDRFYSQKLTLDLVKICFLVSFAAIFVLACLPSATYIFIFGEEFAELPGIIRILSPGVLTYTIFLILGHYYSGIGKYQMNTYASLCGLIFTFVLGFTLIPQMDIWGAAITSSVAYSVNAIFLLFFFIKESPFKGKNFLITFADIKTYWLSISLFISNKLIKHNE